MRRALAAAITGILLVPGALLADDAVPAAPEPPPSTAPAVAPAGASATAAEDETKPAPEQPPQQQPQPVVAEAKQEPRPKKKKEGAKVIAAASGGVTIRNFAFAPATIDIDAGDTVTWTNRDSAPHTATGSGFDTGTLKEGQSGSHTFAKPGRFAYICAIHPNMRGTVVVAAATAGAPSPGTRSPSRSAASPAAPAQAENRATLPNTGLQLLVVALTGGLFTAMGIALRWLGQRADRRV